MNTLDDATIDAAVQEAFAKLQGCLIGVSRTEFRLIFIAGAAWESKRTYEQRFGTSTPEAAEVKGG